MKLKELVEKLHDILAVDGDLTVKVYSHDGFGAYYVSTLDEVNVAKSETSDGLFVMLEGD